MSILKQIRWGRVVTGTLMIAYLAWFWWMVLGSFR